MRGHSGLLPQRFDDIGQRKVDRLNGASGLFLEHQRQNG
jgi:hypothetical protein